MNINDKDIEKLANLARIKLSNNEKKGLGKDIESILGYVSKIQDVSSDMPDDRFNNLELINVMRKDKEPHDGGLYTKKILDETPDKEKDYVKVKKIL